MFIVCTVIWILLKRSRNKARSQYILLGEDPARLKALNDHVAKKSFIIRILLLIYYQAKDYLNPMKEGYINKGSENYFNSGKFKKKSKSEQIEDLQQQIRKLNSEIDTHIRFRKVYREENIKYENAGVVQYDSEDDLFKMNLVFTSVMKVLAAYENKNMSAEKCLEQFKEYLKGIVAVDWLLSGEGEKEIRDSTSDTNKIFDKLAYLSKALKARASRGDK